MRLLWIYKFYTGNDAKAIRPMTYYVLMWSYSESYVFQIPHVSMTSTHVVMEHVYTHGSAVMDMWHVQMEQTNQAAVCLMITSSFLYLSQYYSASFPSNNHTYCFWIYSHLNITNIMTIVGDLRGVGLFCVEIAMF